MKSIIGIGTVGFDGLRYFESNFSNVPRCALLLSDKNFEEQAKKLKAYSDIISEDNLFKIDKSNPILSIQLKDKLKELSKDKDVYILVGLAGSVSGNLSINIVEIILKIANNVVCLGVLPYKFEGFKKKESAAVNSALLKKLGIEVIEMDNQELLELANEKTTFTEASEIHFRKMVQLIGLKVS